MVDQPDSERLSEEETRAWERAQKTWQVWEWDTVLGKVSWTGEDIFVRGPHADRLQDILDSMGRGMTQKELWDSLPLRLTGHIFLVVPEPFDGTMKSQT
jgi:hypothetical protein